MTEMRIYVACLSSYNAGKLHGDWIDVQGKTKDEIYAEIRGILSTSTEPYAEEWAIHDYEGFPCKIGEYEDLDRIVELADFIDGLEEWQENAALALLAEEGAEDLDRVKELLEDGFRGGPFTHEGDYAEEFLEGIGADIPDTLKGYIDYEKMERDGELSGDIRKVETSDGFYVFDGCL